MTTKPPPTGQPRPVQKRSLESRQKILNSAEQLFAEKGYRATKISDLIAVSGCSAGSFYHQFTDKREVATILYERYLDSMQQVIGQLADDIEGVADIRAMLARVLGMALTALSAHVGARAAVLDLSQEAPDLAERGYQLTNQFLTQVRDKLGVFSEQIGHEDPVVAIEQALQMNLIVLTQHTLRPRRHLPADNDALIQLLTDAACGVLRVPGPGETQQ